MPPKTAIAIGAHPDDIEFYMAGTLLLLGRAGYEIHYLTVANGNCGSTKMNGRATAAARNKEARAAAGILGAQFHAPMTRDLEIFYSLPLLRRLAAVIRSAKPSIVLTHSPQDYMEDHTNTSRLAVTAAFARGAPNFKTVPSRAAGSFDTAVYHAMPHGLRDGLRRRIVPGAFVNTTDVQEIKRRALAAHKSQQEWLDASQGLSSFLATMDNMGLEVGKMSGRFQYAEGWRRHLHLGFAGTDADPLAETLGEDYCVNNNYERSLEEGA
jgi:LmbE family N-acetylglucosaminyl deacetylase